MPDVREVYEMVTKQKPVEPGALQRQQKRQVRAARNKKIGALAVAAAIGLTALVLALVNQPGRGTVPANPPSTVTPSDAAATQVVLGFLDAVGTFDTERAITYLADDADISGLVGTQGGGVKGTPQDLRLFVPWLEATGYEQILGPCEAMTIDAETIVDCPFDVNGLRSAEIGRGPFSGSSFSLAVRDGKIVRASMNWDISKFSSQLWEPFERWVSRTYPEDARVMYTDGTHTNYRLTKESIRLWDQRTREYVKDVNQGTAQ